MSAQFVVEAGALKGLLLSLEEGEEWILGRDPSSCQLILEDQDIDLKQLFIRKEQQNYFINSLSEKHISLINGKPIKAEVKLQDNDLITMGKNVLRFTSGVKIDELQPFDSNNESLEEEGAFDVPLEESPLGMDEAIAVEEGETAAFHVDLTPTMRFILKVIAGPNTGAEFSVDLGREYLLGTDVIKCDIVLHDLSVSKEHAKLTVSDTGQISIIDLGSRNGVLVDQKKIKEKTDLSSNSIVTLGTTSFFIIDREAPQETIATAVFDRAIQNEEPPQEPAEVEEKKPEAAAPPKKKRELSPQLSGACILSAIVIAFATLFGFGILALSQPKEVVIPDTNYEMRLHEALKGFPEVSYSYNKTTHKLFLVGHVTNGIRLNELHYNLQGLSFIKGIDDNIVDDEAVWQEMNLILSKNPQFAGVSMHSPRPGIFVLSGYLKTEVQGAALRDYLNLHFNYLPELLNQVVVEEQVIAEVFRKLMQAGFANVTAEFLSGELTLTGYIGSTTLPQFSQLLKDFGQMQGIRKVSNFVVMVSLEQQVVDLNSRYPGRFVITGYSKHGDVNINVVINGKILTRGDVLDGMTITSIQPHTIFLEREGLKYKIDYNK